MRDAGRPGASRVAWVVALLVAAFGVVVVAADPRPAGTDRAPAGALDVLALAVGGGSDDDSPDFLDVTVHNKGVESATVSGVRLAVLELVLLPNCESGGLVGPGWTAADIELPAEARTGDVVDATASRIIRPGEVDRFPLTIGVREVAGEEGTRLYQVDVFILFGSMATPMPAGRAIVAAPVEPIGSRYVIGQGSADECKRTNWRTLTDFLALPGARSASLRPPPDPDAPPRGAAPPPVPEPIPYVPSGAPTQAYLPGTLQDYEGLATSEGLVCQRFTVEVLCVGHIEGEAVLTSIAVASDDAVAGLALDTTAPSDSVLRYFARLARVAIESDQAEEWILSAPTPPGDAEGVVNQFGGVLIEISQEFEGSWMLAITPWNVS